MDVVFSLSPFPSTLPVYDTPPFSAPSNDSTLKTNPKVGCTATDPSSGQQGRPGDFSKLFRRVFPAVLRLAVDLDETTRTLFSKLSMQLVRWFSQVCVFLL